MQESSPRSLGLQIPTPSSESHSGRVSNTSLLQQYLDTSASDPSDHSQTFETKDEPEPEARASGASPTREQDPRQLKRRSTGSRTLRPEDIQPQSPSVHQDAGHTRRSSTSSSVDLGARGLWQGTTVAPPPPEDEEHPQYPPASRPYDLANSYSLEDIQLSGDSKTSLDQSTASQQPYVSYTPPYKQYRAQQGVSLQQNAQAGPSGLQRSSTLLQRTGQALRRASVRVVNLGGQDHEAMSAAAVHENELYDQQQQRRRRRRSQQHQQEWPPREEDVESDAGFSLDEQGQQPKATLHHDLAAKTVNQPGWPPDTLPSPPPHVQTVAPQHMLMGRTLNMFGPTHPVRKMALKLMLNWWIEPLILLLIIANVVVLTIQAAPSVFDYPRPTSPGYFHTWHDTVLFILMCIFSVEIALRIIVSGLIFSPTTHWWVGTNNNKRSSSAPSASTPEKRRSNFFQTVTSPLAGNKHHGYQAPLARTRTDLSLDNKPQGTILSEVPFRLAVDHLQQITVSQKAYLRHSYNRIDLVAVVSFWITVALAATGVEHSKWLYIFRGLSVLRAARLLTFTTGSLIILHSLKRAGPSLLRVAFFFFFAMSLFAIVGVQSFNGSYRRECIWIDPAGQSNFSTGQICGSWFDEDNKRQIYLEENGQQAQGITWKGFACPQGQICLTKENPEGGSVSFDHIFTSAFQILVITSNNGWSGVMYDMMSAEMFFSCLFFIVALIIMNYWLINMFVAVITYTFDTIVRDTKHSAFSAHAPRHLQDTHADRSNMSRRRSWFRTLIRKSELFWVLIVIADTAVQASRLNNMSPQHSNLIKTSALVFTLIFDLEIVLRLLSDLPDWKAFISAPRNRLDLFLAVITTILLIPPIPASAAYPWLSVFERLRFYRVPLTIPRTRYLLVRLGGSLGGLSNMVLFLFMMSFVATLFAVQFLRGEIPEQIEEEDVFFPFFQIYNGFLGIYQVLTSEDWTNVVYTSTSTAPNLFNVVVNYLFFGGWFIIANFIVLQMFIAVINEGFEMFEDEKLKEQEARFAQGRQVKQPMLASIIRKINFYRKMKPKPIMSVAHIVPKAAVDSSRQAMLEEYLQGKAEVSRSTSVSANDGFTDSLRKLNPTKLLRRKKTVRTPEAPTNAEDWLDVDQHIALLATNRDAEDDESANMKQRRVEEVDFIMSHPTYDISLWFFSQQNRLRRFCQTLVTPPHGVRIFGEPPHSKRVTTFQLIIFFSIVASIVIAATATPHYRQKYFIDHGNLRATWFNISEASLGFFFVAEFFVKIVADGFVFTPNAYLLSIWNIVDFIVLITLVINVAAAIAVGGEAPSGLRALKAFRALRLVNLSPRIRKTFYDVLIIGATRLFDALLLAVLFLIPYAVWGQALFAGKLFFCNDSDVSNKFQCVGEFVSNPVNWEFLAPRAWTNPYVWSFDAFHWAILILFELVSLEGWIDVVNSTKNIVGIDQQPRNNASQFNAVFLVIYMLLGGLFIFALFTAIIIENFRIRSGMALLTAEQRRWIDVQKLLMQQKPSRRPRYRPTDPFSSWCYDRTIQKSGWWARTMTTLYVLHTLLLMTESFGQPDAVKTSRDYVFLAFTFIFAFDILFRLFGLGFRMFRLSWWNIYDTAAVVGTFATTIPALTGGATEVEVQFQKLFLVSLSLNLIQKNDALNQLFKTAMASVHAILNILALWLILFLLIGIADMEIFSLTRWMENEAFNVNFGDMLTTLVMLGFMSSGEAWNSFMHDYAVKPPLCTQSSNFLFSDCGSPAWAYFLFFTWNIISMYIFASMFIGVVVENFSYVFQLKGRVRQLSREDMRSFKRAWTICDPNRTGYIRRRQLAPLFAKLTGVFDVKIYPDDSRLSSVLHHSVVAPFNAASLRDEDEARHGVVAGVDLHLLSSKLRQIDYDSIAKRRAAYNRLYHEALLLSEKGKGLSFKNTLMLLAHYKLLESEKSLLFDQRVQRQQRMAEIQDFIGLDKVRSLLITVHYRREFLRYRQMKEGRARGVPHIRIDTGLAAPNGPAPLSAVLRSPSQSPPGSPGGTGSPLENRETPDVAGSPTSRLSRTGSTSRPLDATSRSRSPSPGPLV